MKLRIPSLLAALCLPMIGLPAQAEKPVGNESVAARESVSRFATCAVRKSTKSAIDFVIDRPRAELSSFENLLDSSCLTGGELHMPILILRGAIAEALLERGGRIQQTFDFAQVGPLVRPPTKPVTGTDKKGRALTGGELERAKTLSDRILLSDYLETIAECAIRAKAEDMPRLLATKVASPEETAVLRSMAPSLGACVPTGNEFTFKREPMRAALAATYLELLMAKEGRRRQLTVGDNDA